MGFALLCRMICLANLYHDFNYSEAKVKHIMTCSFAFSCPSGSNLIFIWGSHRLLLKFLSLSLPKYQLYQQYGF